MGYRMKILFCSDSLKGVTGMNHVSINIMEGLFNTYPDVEIVHCTFTGQPSQQTDFTHHGFQYLQLFEKLSFEYCPTLNEKKQQMFDAIILKHKPDIVFAYTDCWYLEPIAYSAYRDNFTWINYLTFETANYPQYCYFPCFNNRTKRIDIKNLLSLADMNIPVAEIGTMNLQRFGVPFVKNVYHGLDHHIYNNLSEEKLTKSEVFGRAVKDDDFVFMTLGKNSERKRIDFVIDAFAYFLYNHVSEEKKNKYKLFIHSDINETRDSGTDLLTLIHSYGIDSNVLVSKCFVEKKPMSKEDILRRYKVSDCYVSLSVGEGFGLGVADALLCGVPVIYSRETAVEELCNGCGYPVKTIGYVSARNNNIKFVYPSIEDAGKLMNTMVKEIKTASTKQMKENAKKKASELTWGNCVKGITDVIDKVYKPKKNKYFLRKI